MDSNKLMYFMMDRLPLVVLDLDYVNMVFGTI